MSVYSMTLKYNKWNKPGVLEVNGDQSVPQKEDIYNCIISVLVLKLSIVFPSA